MQPFCLDQRGFMLNLNKSICIVALAAIVFQAYALDQMSILIGDIKSGPSVYFSPQAQSYFEKNGQTISSGNKDDALRCYRAAIKLGDLGSGANRAVPVLVEQFPKAIHVAEIKAARYAGEGTFEDWLSTYVMNEKNKFMLASPFMDYNGMSTCEQYIDATPQVTFIEKNEVSKIIRSAAVDITITFTVYVGSCALSRISGQTIGNEQNDWRLWWAQNGGEGIGNTEDSLNVMAVIASGQDFKDIVVKGKYRMSLKTGDDFVGTVESKDDTSMIFETIDGKPFVFSRRLIDRFDLLELPKSLQKQENKVDESAKQQQREATALSWDELLQNKYVDSLVEVTIQNGSIFKGKLVAVDNSMIKLNIQGTEIPIARNMAVSVTDVPPQIVKDNKNAPAKSSGPLDTVVMRNTETDEYGNSLPDLIVFGTITREDKIGITMKLTDGAVKLIKQTQVVRVIKHSQDTFDEPIRRYAKQLNCPQGMVLVDLPPGMQGRPFFKVCIDKYEYPNKEGIAPQVNVSYSEAQKLCLQHGKRLCTSDEWQWSCSGRDGFVYPYGKALEENRCNTEATQIIEASGSRVNCFSKFGAFDMVGNVFEWVSDQNSKPALMGGPYSKCQTVSPGVGGDAKPINGFRCCKSN